MFLFAVTGGTLPFEESVIISNSGTLATVTHTSHDMDTGDKINITDSNVQANNGVHVPCQDEKGNACGQCVQKRCEWYRR